MSQLPEEENQQEILKSEGFCVEGECLREFMLQYNLFHSTETA